MQARAGAIDELIASGALDDVSAISGGDDITRELDAMSSQADVEAELARLKGLSAGASARGHRGRADGGEILERRAGEAREPPDASRGRPAVIVRILGEGQYDVADDALDRLNELDAALEAAVEAGDERGVRRRAGRAARRRAHRRRGRTPPTALDESDLILPPADATHRRGPRAAQRRRSDPGLNTSVAMAWHVPLRPRHRAHRPDDHGHVPARRAVRRRSSSR